MKFITGIVAFTLTFIFSVALVGFPIEVQNNNQTQQNIASLVQRDVRNGDETFNKTNSCAKWSVFHKTYPEIVNEYVDKSESMNDADLPSDFQLAWREHMKAWRNYADFLNDSETEKMDTSDFTRLNSNYNREISVTWQEVLQIGREYGATLSY